MATQWYFSKDGDSNGPLSAPELKQLADNGALLATDFVWREGLDEWVRADQVRGLFSAAHISPAKEVVMPSSEGDVIASKSTAVPSGLPEFPVVSPPVSETSKSNTEAPAEAVPILSVKSLSNGLILGFVVAAVAHFFALSLLGIHVAGISRLFVLGGIVLAGYLGILHGAWFYGRKLFLEMYASSARADGTPAKLNSVETAKRARGVFLTWFTNTRTAVTLYVQQRFPKNVSIADNSPTTPAMELPNQPTGGALVPQTQERPAQSKNEAGRVDLPVTNRRPKTGAPSRATRITKRGSPAVIETHRTQSQTTAPTAGAPTRKHVRMYLATSCLFVLTCVGIWQHRDYLFNWNDRLSNASPINVVRDESAAEAPKVADETDLPHADSHAPVEELDPVMAAESKMLERLSAADEANDSLGLADIAKEFTGEHPENHLVWMHATFAYLKAARPEQSLESARECERLLEALPEEMQPSLAATARFWSHVGSAHLDCAAPHDALICFKKAAKLDASFEAIAQQLSEHIENVTPSPQALAKAEQLDEVAPDFEASLALRIDREGVVVLTEPKHEEIRGKVLGITTSGSVALLYTQPDTREPKLLLFPKGTIARIFNGNEVEMSRYHQIMQAGFNAYPLFREFGSVCSLRFDPSASKFMGHHSRLAPYSGGLDQLLLNESLAVSEVEKYWQTLDAKRSSLKAPYTWTREFAHECREREVTASTDIDYNINVLLFTVQRKKGVARFLNLPVDGPYSKYEIKEADRFGEGFLDGVTMVMRPTEFLKLSPEEQRNALHVMGKTVRFVSWVRDLDKQQSFSSIANRPERSGSRKISGIIKDRNGKPIPRGTEVIIEVDVIPLSINYRTRTDGDGRFTHYVPGNNWFASDNAPINDPDVTVWLFDKKQKIWQGKIEAQTDIGTIQMK